jgi:uncharacterized membrane protein YsdA (DUF1294 family)/cold shock CspA family protein
MEPSTRYGLVSKWDDDKGYGFIAPRGGGREVFVHIKAFPSGNRRPTVGDSVSYVPDTDGKGRPRANEVLFATEGSGQGVRLGVAGARFLAFAFTFIAVIAAIAAQGYLPWFLPLVYGSASLYAYLQYSLDKAAAQADEQRISEQKLHAMSVVGGWPGALVGQAVHRHKTKKASFRFGFWVTVLANLAALAVVAFVFNST